MHGCDADLNARAEILDMKQHECNGDGLEGLEDTKRLRKIQCHEEPRDCFEKWMTGIRVIEGPCPGSKRLRFMAFRQQREQHGQTVRRDPFHDHDHGIGHDHDHDSR